MLLQIRKPLVTKCAKGILNVWTVAWTLKMLSHASHFVNLEFEIALLAGDDCWKVETFLCWVDHKFDFLPEVSKNGADFGARLELPKNTQRKRGVNNLNLSIGNAGFYRVANKLKDQILELNTKSDFVINVDDNFFTHPVDTCCATIGIESAVRGISAGHPEQRKVKKAKFCWLETRALSPCLELINCLLPKVVLFSKLVVAAALKRLMVVALSLGMICVAFWSLCSGVLKLFTSEDSSESLPLVFWPKVLPECPFWLSFMSGKAEADFNRLAFCRCPKWRVLVRAGFLSSLTAKAEDEDWTSTDEDVFSKMLMPIFTWKK